MKKQTLYTIIGIAISVLIGISAANSGTVTLAQDYDNSTILGGFKIYNRSETGSYNPTNSTTISKTARQAVVTVPQGRRYFVATAFDTYGTESGYSNQVDTVVGTPKIPTGMFITNN